MAFPAKRFQVVKLKFLAAIVDGFHMMHNSCGNRPPLEATMKAQKTIPRFRGPCGAAPLRTLIETLCLPPRQNAVLDSFRRGTLAVRAKAPAARQSAAATSSLDSLFAVRLMSRKEPASSF